MAKLVQKFKPLNYNSSGGAGGSQEIKFPRVGRIDRIDLKIDWQATFAAGAMPTNPFSQIIDELILGDENQRLLEFRSNEVQNIVPLLTPGKVDGRYNDPTAATATNIRTQITLTGPFKLNGLKDPKLRLNIGNVSAGLALTVTAFQATVTVTVYWSAVQDKGSGIVVRRGFAASATDLKITAPDILLHAFLLIAGTADVVVRFTLGSEFVMDDAYEAAMNWAVWNNTAIAASPTLYFVQSTDSVPVDGIDLLLHASAATTATVFFVGVN